MRRFGASALVGITLAALACAGRFEKEEKAIEEQPVNCATAEGDVRILQGEKAHVAEQIALGVTAVYPAGLVVGLVTGTEGTKLRVATGEYNRMIDEKIARIRAECGLE